ncbi:MAG: hypothetical protein U0R50_13360 [Gaiellales bacterium]
MARCPRDHAAGLTRAALKPSTHGALSFASVARLIIAVLAAASGALLVNVTRRHG